MKKVLQLCTFYPINTLYRQLFEELSVIGCESTVYVACKERLVNLNQTGNLEIIYNGAFKNGDDYIEKLFNIYSQYRFFGQEKKIFKNLSEKIDFNKFNIIHAHSLYIDGYLAYLAHERCRTDYVVALRNTDVNVYLKHALHLRKIGIEIMRNAKSIIFISESYKKEVLNKYVPKDEIQEFMDKSLVIPNGIDEYWLDNSLTEEKAINKNCINLIQVGRIDKNKNIETSVKICDELNAKGISSKITFVGDGPLKDKYVSKYKNNNSVIFKAKAPKEIVKDYLNDSDIFIMPSKYETFGLVYPEAMSQGLPIIYTRNQGFDNFFEEGYVGYSMIYNDVKYGVEAVEKIIKNYSEISRNATYNVKRFSWKEIAQRYYKVYI
ncbi:MAG: glycosyltransferase family 4 protein [Clostridium sp.]|nr:glycosyltransferase family 4 protein [Clostridium sp.]